MGAGGVPNRTVEIIYGRSGNLATQVSKPNSRYDLISNGKRIQSRWYDAEGKVVRNRDYIHQDVLKNHVFPHDHIWSWINGKPIRDITPVSPDYLRYKD